MVDFTTYDFDIAQVILAIRVGYGQGDRFHRNRPSHGLVYMLDGKNTYRFSNGRMEMVYKHQLFYLPKFSTYEVVPPLQGVCIAINFLLHDDQLTFPFFQLPPEAAKHCEKYFTQAQHVWKTKPVGYQLKCKSLLYELLYEIQKGSEHAYLPEAQRNRLHIAVEYIRQRYLTEDISIAELANIAGVTPEYLRILFQKAYGMSTHKYIAQLKIARAQELLKTGEFTINQIAELCGYNSTGYFTREFKKQTLLTPLEYKKQSS
ncbi:MAG TPA: AraC family transcriptional regulator [Armatimonadota bacterium]|nr:AraC family transcriptional regulator [Armatimonadota bacterium]